MSDIPLPPDILAQILSWLPITSLLRFRSISKPLKSLIDSRHFINLHLHHSTQTNLIFGGDRTLSYCNLDSSPPTVTNIHNPLYFAIYETVILGSCNGVLCLCTSEPDNEIAFWNPLVRKFKKTRLAPAKCVDGLGRGVCVKGFGYDGVSDDYKVVRLVQYVTVFKELVHSKMEVFSLRNETWREIGDFGYHLLNRRCLNVLAGGALHWLVSRDPDVKVEFLIAAFDFAKEEMGFVPLPDFVNGKVKVSQVNLGVLGGCLCMICNFPEKNVEIWVMKRYGVRESWSKLISTSEVKIMSELDVLRPIVYSKSGHEVLLEKNFERLYWYDLESKTSKRFKAAGMPRLFVTHMFTGSLVEVNIGSVSQDVRRKEKDEKNNKKKDDFLSKGFRLVL